ncbi:DUF2178 domain-containing protein [Streptococcus equi]|uniref:DUF2178 domain-containing protein n=1 Tax=Streptococcus equi subsp. equi TaxID=148942 RepID=A0A380JPX1_9STRE|nr:DUF2178 domain-containing protein [Streptococcus equi]MCD3394421.1 DUF2178 domain-containing protein [Streptococcus equi subsp. zooepidemicus]MCD3449970.1 DUF2178 domain-containing protein [Streptococcus equi subsp. zooepidemicus]MCD3454797.1 DUF2178 domain-containing protein [Streptococcus equi subsp. zooepidemicus]QTR93774.1 hypothetical protein IEMOCGPF_00855 [Streptococcus equi subsp. zooepidemicus]SUN46592.1 Uncharacterised protein [Streptococcus equi subsp. equi]
MKYKNLWYLGYVLSAIALISAFVFKENRIIEVISVFTFAISLSVTYVQTNHYKMMVKDKDYRINVTDERAEKIRDKVNATMCAVLMFMNSIIALTLRETISAILLVTVTAISPLLIILLNRYFEKKY